jgi:hypothetical protein
MPLDTIIIQFRASSNIFPTYGYRLFCFAFFEVVAYQEQLRRKVSRLTAASGGSSTWSFRNGIRLHHRKADIIHIIVLQALLMEAVSVYRTLVYVKHLKRLPVQENFFLNYSMQRLQYVYLYVFLVSTMLHTSPFHHSHKDLTTLTALLTCFL